MGKLEDGSTDYGNSCIWTALSNYGKKYRVSGNLQFFGNPEAYGFVALDNVEDALPGDFIQGGNFWNGNNQPNHGMLLDHVDDSGRMLLNYSNGSRDSSDSKAMRKNSNYFAYVYDCPDPDDGINNHAKAYRFVGLPEDWETWTQEYDSNYSPIQVLPPISLDLPKPVLRLPETGIAK